MGCEQIISEMSAEFDAMTENRKQSMDGAILFGRIQGAQMCEVAMDQLYAMYQGERELNTRLSAEWACEADLRKKDLAELQLFKEENARILCQLQYAWAAVDYVFDRIQSDPDLSYYCGSLTETFQRCCKAVAEYWGQDVSKVRAKALANIIATQNRRDPEVLELRKRIEELQEQLGE